MLHLESVEANTLDVLRRLLSLNALSSFKLVGGTTLSLKYGHRKSIDIELFSSVDFSNEELFESVSSLIPDFTCSSL